MARRNDHSKQELKDLTINAGYELLAETSIERLSTRKIASHIGYSVGTLYNLFDNQAAIHLRLNERTLQNLKQQCTEASEGQRPMQAIISIATTYIHFAKQNSNYWLAVFNLKLPEGEHLPTWYLAEVQQLFKLIEDQLSDLCPNAPESEITKTARILWSSVHGVTQLSLHGMLFNEDIASEESMIEDLIIQFLSSWFQKF